jgi:hypothetical protein
MTRISSTLRRRIQCGRLSYPEDFNEDEIAEQYMGELPQLFLSFFSQQCFLHGVVTPHSF